MELSLDDITVHYEMDGPDEAPVIACSHCLAGDLRVWDEQVDALRRKYRVLRYDARGHGRTSAPKGPYTLEMLAADLIGLLDGLAISRAHIMGISMGGMVAQTLALMRPERILSLILCDTTASMPKEHAPLWEERIQTAEQGGMAALAGATLDRWLSADFQKNHPERTRQIMEIVTNTPVPGFAGSARAISRLEMMAELNRIHLPTLVMVGEHDPGTPVASARQIQEQIPDARLEVLPGAYHLSNIEAASAFNGHLLNFLEKF
jgi:3-oxoadipate enol-lactonase